MGVGIEKVALFECTYDRLIRRVVDDRIIGSVRKKFYRKIGMDPDFYSKLRGKFQRKSGFITTFLWPGILNFFTGFR